MNQTKSDKWISYLLLAALFLPLIYTPGVLFPYQYGKALLFEVFIGMAAAIWLVYARKEKFLFSPVFWAFAAFLAIRFIAGFLGGNPEKSFWGDHIRMTGNFTYLFFFLFFILLRETFGGEKRERLLLKIVAISGAIGAVLAIWQRYTSAGERIFGGSGDWLFGSFGNPSYLAGYLLLVIFFTALFLRRENDKKKKIFWAAILCGEIVLLVATSTRGAIVGLLVGIIAAGVTLLIISRSRLWRGIGAAGIILPIVIIAGSLFIYFGPGRESAPGRLLGSLLRANTAETRLINWAIAVDGFKAKPVFGWGPENYEDIFSKFYRTELINYSWVETWSDRPHNIALEVASGSGILGLASYLLLFFIPLLVMVRAVRRGRAPVAEAALGAGGMAAFFTQGFFFFDTFSTLLLFSALLAFIDLRFGRGRESAADSAVPEKSFSRTAQKAFAGVILAAVFFGAILPVRASHYADRTAEDLAVRDYAQFEKDFSLAINSWTPHQDDIAKIFADDVLKGDASGLIPREIVKAVLPELAEYLQKRSDAHPQVYALALRSAQIYELAGEYINQEYFEKSEQMFKRAESISPLRQTGIVSRALMETARGNYAEAARLSGILLELSPNFAEAYFVRGIALAAAGDNDGAEKIFDGLIARSTSLVQASSKSVILRRNNFVLDFYASRKKYEKMVPLLEALIKEQFPNMAELHMRLAAVYAMLGRFDDARAEAMKTISLDPARRADVEEFIGALEDINRQTQ